MSTPFTSFETLSQACPASSTFVYKGQLVDENSAPVPGNALSALTLSVCDSKTGAIINGVSQINILNTGRGNVDTNGNVTVTIGAHPNELDTALQVATHTLEQRSLILDWSYNGGVTFGRHQVRFLVAALSGP